MAVVGVFFCPQLKFWPSIKTYCSKTRGQKVHGSSGFLAVLFGGLAIIIVKDIIQFCGWDGSLSIFSPATKNISWMGRISELPYSFVASDSSQFRDNELPKVAKFASEKW